MESPQKTNEPLSTAVELEIVGRLARGDTYSSIARDLEVSPGSITNVKKRNEAALAYIQQQLVEEKASSATRILKKSHQIIEKKLDAAQTYEEKRREIWENWHNSDHTDDDRKERDTALAGLRDVTLTEATSVAREMFNQSQVEQGKPTAITATEQKERVKDLAERIKNGDVIELQRLILTDD